MDLNKKVQLAQEGDRQALEYVVLQIQDRVYHLAMRMLVNPEDARDATQDILVRVVTKLSTFSGESAFDTWVYRVAVNYLLTARKVLERDPGLSFEIFRQDLEDGLVDVDAVDPQYSAELNELRISCTMAMLLCLDLKHRIAYVLGDIFELDHREASEILGITPTNFRKRLSRAREKVIGFTAASCGLVSASARCSCSKRLPRAMELGRIAPGGKVYDRSDAPTYSEVLAKTKGLERDLRTIKLQQAIPHFSAPADFRAIISRLLDR